MPIDLTYSDEVRALTERTRAFVRETVLPIEDEHHGDITAAGGDQLRVTLNEQA
ncbi:acyl-CoA dehydrogenase, partial [Nocardia sp. NPDC019302]